MRQTMKKCLLAGLALFCGQGFATGTSVVKIVNNQPSDLFSMSGVALMIRNLDISTGDALYGQALALGVKGVGTSTSADSYGVIGFSGTGTGVLGEGLHIGVYGEDISTDGSGYGVGSSGDMGVSGDLYVDGQLIGELNAGSVSFAPITSYISLTAAAFHVAQEQTPHTNLGNVLKLKNANDSANFVAELQLPQGAEITGYSLHWTDQSQGTAVGIIATLYRDDLKGGDVEMARLNSDGLGIQGSSTTSTINHGVIDNSQYAYYIWLTMNTDIFGSEVKLHGVTLEYQFSQFY